jgi:hypothetical protein
MLLAGLWLVFWRCIVDCATFVVSQKVEVMKTIYCPFTKVEGGDDGILHVQGIASAPVRDADGEIVAADAIRRAIPDFIKFGGTGALREMHQAIAAGKVDAISVGDDDITRISASVLDESSQRKIRHGVLRGFSLGGKATARNPDNFSEITSVVISEISLVDRPSCPSAVITLWKAAMSEVEIDDQRRVNQVIPAILSGEPDFYATFGRVMRQIEMECREKITVALTMATADLRRELGDLVARVNSLAPDPGGRTGLRSPQGPLSDDQEPGTGGTGDLRKGLDPNPARDAVLRSNGPPIVFPQGGAIAKGGAEPDAFTRSLSRDIFGLIKPNAPAPAPGVISKQAASDAAALKKMLDDTHNYDFLQSN